MSRQTNLRLCERLHSTIMCTDTHYHLAIPADRGASSNHFVVSCYTRRVSYHFSSGVAGCTVCVYEGGVCCHWQCSAMDVFDWQRLEIVQGFESTWGLPQCFGAVDGSHIPVLSPKGDHTDYIFASNTL